MEQLEIYNNLKKFGDLSDNYTIKEKRLVYMFVYTSI